jgi:hypothetical protein
VHTGYVLFIVGPCCLSPITIKPLDLYEQSPTALLLPLAPALLLCPAHLHNPLSGIAQRCQISTPHGPRCLRAAVLPS